MHRLGEPLLGVQPARGVVAPGKPGDRVGDHLQAEPVRPKEVLANDLEQIDVAAIDQLVGAA